MKLVPDAEPMRPVWRRFGQIIAAVCTLPRGNLTRFATLGLIAALLALPGLGAVIDGVFTLEHFFLHFVGFGLALTTVVGFPVIGFLLHRVPGWRGFGSCLIVGGPVTLALTVLYFATFTPTIEGVQHGVAGLTERILVVELQAWYVALGWLAFTRPKGNSAVP